MFSHPHDHNQHSHTSLDPLIIYVLHMVELSNRGGGERTCAGGAGRGGFFEAMIFVTCARLMSCLFNQINNIPHAVGDWSKTAV